MTVQGATTGRSAGVPSCPVRVVFVALGQEQLGISMLSAVLRANGHETALVFSPALFNDRYYFDIPIL